MKSTGVLENFSIFEKTLYASFAIQIFSFIIDIIALFLKTAPFMSLIKQLLVLEIVVQFIEGVMYYWIIQHAKVDLNITPKRYIDWFITTPTMLITLICYLVYLEQVEKVSKDDDANTKPLQMYDILVENKETVIWVIALNALMLIFGFLGEIKVIPYRIAIICGFIPFIIYFYMIYKKFAVNSKKGLIMFYYFLGIWSCYGISAFFPYYTKNVSYNILDLFAKNFFGIFLSLLVFKNHFVGGLAL